MKRLLPLIAVIALGACGAERPLAQDHEQSDVGRYVVIAGSSEYPAMIVDTVSGCAKALTPMERLAKPNADLQYTEVFDVVKVDVGVFKSVDGKFSSAEDPACKASDSAVRKRKDDL